jgi:hypothetical protein
MGKVQIGLVVIDVGVKRRPGYILSSPHMPSFGADSPSNLNNSFIFLFKVNAYGARPPLVLPSIILFDKISKYVILVAIWKHWRLSVRLGRNG